MQHEKELEALRAKTEEASRIKAAEDARKKKEADDQLKAEEEEHQRQLRAEQGMSCYMLTVIMYTDV